MRTRVLLVVSLIVWLLPSTALAQTGGISGTVTGPGGGPLAGIDVWAVNGAFAFIASGTTNVSGIYTISGIAPGTYYIHTSTSSGLINEMYDDHPCAGFCAAADLPGATPVVVSSGATTTGRNFVLAQGGSITGTVRDQATMSPLNGVQVRITSSAGTAVGTFATNASGVFQTVVGLASGTYYAHTSNALGYFNEIFDDVQCGVGCASADAPKLGTPIAVSAPAVTSSVNFNLTKGATISGTIADSGTGLPIGFATVVVLEPTGVFVTSDLSDASGQYTAGPLQAGSYLIYTFNDAGYINEIHDEVPCMPACSALSGGTPIPVAVGQAVTGKNFALAAGGRITGTVRDAITMLPLPGIPITVFSHTGVIAGNAVTDGSGVYQVSSGLPTGPYYAVTGSSGDYRNEIFDNVPCNPNCLLEQVLASTPIAVVAGVTTPNKDFSLDRAGSLSGRITGPSGDPVPGVLVSISERSGLFSTATTTDAMGNYRARHLPTGSYTVFTFNAHTRGVVNEIYPDIPCPGVCNFEVADAVGTPVAVTVGVDTPGIDFALAGGGGISGVVTNAATGAPIPNVTVRIFGVAVDRVSQIDTTVTDTNGAYNRAGLPTGNYHALTMNDAGFVDEIYGNLPCRGRCANVAVAAGQPIAVTTGATTTANFALDAGGRLGGRVTNASTLAPVEGAAIAISDARGETVTVISSGNAGAWQSAALPAGSYFASVASAIGLVAEIYGDIPCPVRCSTLTAAAVGAPIAVHAGATTGGVDFALTPGATLAGRITDSATGVWLSGVEVDIYNSQGRRVDESFSNGDYFGNRGLPDGTYFAQTKGSNHHVEEVFDGIPCAHECPPSRVTTGTPIVVSGGGLLQRDIGLAPATGVPGPPLGFNADLGSTGLRFTWFAPEQGGVATSYQLEAGFASGTTAITIPAAGQQFLAGVVPPGRYYVRLRGVNAAGVGVPSAELTVVIGGGALLPAAPDTLRASIVGTRLLLWWSQPGSAGVPSNYVIEAGSGTGLANITAIPVTAPAFTYDPVPPGAYFLRVRAMNAAGLTPASNEVMIVAGGAASPPAAPEALSATVAGSTVNLFWIAPPGSVTGYVLEAGSATGLSNLATVSIGATTSASFAGVAAGTYYVRIRAVNAAGRSVVSDEIVIVVG